jgi:hypothetical protein
LWRTRRGRSTTTGGSPNKHVWDRHVRGPCAVQAAVQIPVFKAISQYILCRHARKVYVVEVDKWGETGGRLGKEDQNS